jgi:hypothetical protein
MKCVLTKVAGIIRVTDKQAQEMVSAGKAEYVGKEQWKLNGRKYMEDKPNE